MINSIPVAVNGNEIIKKLVNSLYVLKNSVNTILKIINTNPPITGRFQEIIRTVSIIKDGIRCIKRLINF